MARRKQTKPSAKARKRRRGAAHKWRRPNGGTRHGNTARRVVTFRLGDLLDRLVDVRTYLCALTYPSRTAQGDYAQLNRAMQTVQMRGLVNRGLLSLADMRQSSLRGRDAERQRLEQTIGKAFDIIYGKRLAAAGIALARCTPNQPIPSLRHGFSLFPDVRPPDERYGDEHRRIWKPSVPVLHLGMGFIDAMQNPEAWKPLDWPDGLRDQFAIVGTPGWVEYGVRAALYHMAVLPQRIPEVTTDQLLAIQIENPQRRPTSKPVIFV